MSAHRLGFSLDLEEVIVKYIVTGLQPWDDA